MMIFGRGGFEASQRNRRGRWARPLAEILEGRALLSTITVNSTSDADGSDGSNTLSLRQAIEISNGTLAIGSLSTAQAALVSGALATPNTIDFAIPGTGPFTISPTSSLPSISNPAVIDGDSQPGSHPNTNGPGQGKNTVLQVELDGTLAGANTTGLDLKADGSTVKGLAIGGFGVGLSMESTANLVQGNFIGTDITGTKALPNGKGLVGFQGFQITETIGGTAAAAGNVISGNTGDGMSVILLSLVQGNFVGTDVTGTKALPNGGDGFAFFSSESDTIGGTTAGAGNVISGNLGNGMSLQDSDLVQGNFMGTDVTGTKAVPNGGYGLAAIGGSDTIGGTTAGASNVISGNLGDGLKIDLPQDTVEDNFIGTDITGTKAVPNGGDGISTIFPTFSGPGSFIAISGNVISGNAGNGLLLGSLWSVSGNFIGTDITGTHSIPNGGDGINVQGHSDRISGNSIDANGGLGIDLGGDGVTPNNPAGSPTGPNLLQPYPLITSAAGSATGTSISATLDAKPSTFYIVEFFSNPVADPSGFGQGKTFLGSTVVTSDTSGHASISFSSRANLVGQAISATATDPSGNTSEFARDVTAVSLTPTTTELLGTTQIATVGVATTFEAVVEATSGGVPTGQVDFFQDGSVIGSAPVQVSGVAILVTTSLSPGPHAITAVYLGDPTHATSQSDAVAVGVFAPHAFGGPSVTSDVFTGPNSVSIAFNRGLFVGPAEDFANYAIIGPNHHAITIDSAVYDPKTNLVTLSTIQKLDPSKSYQLTINGEKGDRVVDVYGIPLNGQPHGRPGHDFVGKIKKAPTVKVAHPLAPKPKAPATASRKGK